MTREELFELLWPGDGADRGTLGARLSVQLAAVRRVLGRGVIADRTCVRLDTTAVELDLVAFGAAIGGGRSAAAVRLHNGPFLPEDAYEDWATTVRDRTTIEYRGALARLIEAATISGRHEEALAHALDSRDADPFDEAAHIAVVTRLLALGRQRDAETAHGTYRTRMVELDVTPQPLAVIAGHLRSLPQPSDSNSE